MKRFLFTLAAIAGALVVSLAIAVSFRNALLEAALSRALTGAGFHDVDIAVTTLAPDRVIMGPARARYRGGEGEGDLEIAIDRLVASYAWRELLSDRRARRIEIEGARLRADLSTDGSWALPDFASSEAPSDRAAPFDAIILRDGAFVLETPFGEARGEAQASVDLARGGEGALTARLAAPTEEARIAGAAIEQASAALRFFFRESGAFSVSGALRGDAATSTWRASDADLAFRVEGEGWRAALREGAPLSARGEARLAELMLSKVDGAPIAHPPSGDAVSRARVSGAAPFRYEGGAFQTVASEGHVEIEAGEMALRLSAPPGEALLIADREGLSAAGVIDATAPFARVAADLDLDRRDGALRLSGPIIVRDLALETISAPRLALSATARMDAAAVAARIALDGDVARARVGRLSLSDAEITGALDLGFDRSARVATARVSDSCLEAPRARLRIAQQNLTARIDRARLCADADAPLLAIDLAAARRTHVRGAISAERTDLQFGETTFVGAPPRAVVAALYEPARKTTDATARLSGGRVILNEAIGFDGVEAEMRLRLNAQTLSAEGAVERLRAGLTGPAPALAPVMMSGQWTLRDDEATFSARMRAPGGAALGAIDGRHALNANAGEATIAFEELSFAPGGLQPSELAPVLKGFVARASGAASGEARLQWTDGEVRSQANIAIDALSFSGPGRTVNRTEAIDGAIAFRSLRPVATNGEQTLRIGRIDLGALVLEEGDVRFEAPGDETLRVREAVFPWFGGTLGVADARGDFDGGDASAPLRADGVDLKAMLDFADIDGLSGEGTLSGSLPVVIENGRAFIRKGRLEALGPGFLSYKGEAAEAAAQSNDQAQVAFDLLRDLRYRSLVVTIDGPLEGRLDFQVAMEGTGLVFLNGEQSRVPVKYTINLDAALLELLDQVNLSRNVQMQIERAVGQSGPRND